MKKLEAFLLALLVLFASSCSQEPTQAPNSDDLGTDDATQTEQLSRAMLDTFGWPVEMAADESALVAEEFAGADAVVRGGSERPVYDFDREVLPGGIAHYSVRIQVGPGPYDVIGLHRVVREQRPGLPMKAKESIFLLHGDIKDFQGMFLAGTTSPTMPDDFGLAHYLASRGMDVWGVDQAWTLVPAGVTDLTFMNDWGMERNVDDLELGIHVARAVRLLTGNGLRQMYLLGYSSGAVTGFGFLDRESQLPPGRRTIKGFISGDFGYKSDHEGLLAAFGAEYEVLRDLLDSGVYSYDSPFPLFGPLAETDPDGPSPLIEGLTNLQAAIGLAAWPFYSEIDYHFLAGVFDSDGVPTGLTYTDVDMWIDFMLSGPPYEAMRFLVEYEGIIVGVENEWDDHLSDIEVPILYLYANGGAGPYTLATLDLIGSEDVTTMGIGFLPPEEAAFDFAHVDLFIANDAPGLVFEPIWDWMDARSHSHKAMRNREFESD